MGKPWAEVTIHVVCGGLNIDKKKFVAQKAKKLERGADGKTKYLGRIPESRESTRG